MCQSVWLPQVAHTTNPWWMAEVYETGSLTRVPGRIHHQIMMVKVVPEFWRILCQIINIKYCAEPSVRELPEYEGCLRLGNKFKRSLNPSRVSCQYQAVNACHQDFFIRTLHLRTKFPCRRRRYCQTRYTRRQYDLIPRDNKSRSLTLGYTQVSDLLSHGVISKSYSYGNEPLSVPTTTESELHHDLSRVWGLHTRVQFDTGAAQFCGACIIMTLVSS